MSTIHVHQLMTEAPVSVGPDNNLLRVRELMDAHDIRHLPVVDDDGSVVGLVSQRDLIRFALAPAEGLTLSAQEDVLRAVTVGTIMTTDVAMVEPDAAVGVAGRIMLDNKYGCVPVVEDLRLTGILTEADFVRYLAAVA